jgi:aldose 1-epimerase
VSGPAGAEIFETGTVRTVSRAGFTSLRLILPRTGESVEILPGLGGTVHRIALAPRTDTPTGPPVEILDSDSDRELAENPRFRGRILFPFNDRIPSGRYGFRGEEFRLAVNDPGSDSAIHGALYRTSMRLTATEPGPDRIGIRLERLFRGDEVEGYPFALWIEAAYSLEPGRFTLRLCAANRGSRAAPVALGWHPYFLAGDRGLPEAALIAAFPSYFEADERALPVGTPVPIAFTAPQDGRIQLRTAYGTLELSYDREPFAFTQLYTPPDRGSVAIEPVTAAPDSFNHPERGLMVLEPGSSVSATISVVLRALK